MKKKIILAALCLSLLISGGMAVYMYLNPAEDKEYKNGIFVDRGENNGYETMYDLYTIV